MSEDAQTLLEIGSPSNRQIASDFFQHTVLDTFQKIQVGSKIDTQPLVDVLGNSHDISWCVVVSHGGKKLLTVEPPQVSGATGSFTLSYDGGTTIDAVVAEKSYLPDGSPHPFLWMGDLVRQGVAFCRDNFHVDQVHARWGVAGDLTSNTHSFWDSVRDQWQNEPDKNQSTWNQILINSALNTWTGQVMNELGFTQVVFKEKLVVGKIGGPINPVFSIPNSGENLTPHQSEIESSSFTTQSSNRHNTG